MSRETLLLSSAEKPKPSRESPVSSSSPSSGQKGMKTRKLEITAISAEGLLDGRKPVKKNTFVTFDIAAENHCIMRTRVDEVGGDCPSWEDKLETEFSLPSKESFMYVSVYCQISGGGGKEKQVATARVPVEDFTGGYGPEGFLHCLSYRLWDGYGNRNGIVNFSARIVPVSKAGLRSFWLR